MRVYATLISAALIACPLSSAGAFGVASTDAFTNIHKWEGRHVLLKDCAITSASREIVGCTSDTPDSASIFLETETLDRTDLKTALELCRGVSPTAQCRADIAGVATRIGSHVMLQHAGIYWQSPDIARTAIEARALLTDPDVLPEGRHVVVRDCAIAGASGRLLNCAISGESEGTNLLIDARSLRDADLQYAMKHCTGWNPAGNCAAHVTGTATKIGSYYRLDNAGVFWTTTEAPQHQ